MKYTSRSLRRRGSSDKWEVSLMHKDPLSGKPVRTFHTVEAKSRRVAERKRNELIMQLERESDNLVMHSNQQFEAFLRDFLDFKERSGSVEPSTIHSYRSIVNMIARTMEPVQVRCITSLVIRNWMADLKEYGYAPRTITKAFRLVRQSLDYAVEQGAIPSNPCSGCKPPKCRSKAVNALSRQGRCRMLKLARQIQPMPLGIAIELALTTGMRRGEICALRWSDFSNDGSITVNRALGEAVGGYYEKDPKTPESRRNIPLTAQTFKMLSSLKERIGQNPQGNDLTEENPYILGAKSANNRPYNPSQLSKDFALLCKMHGFNCTFHSLRHTFATMLIAEGADIKTVSSYLGHASASMTLDIYAEVDPEAKRAAISKIESAFTV